MNLTNPELDFLPHLLAPLCLAVWLGALLTMALTRLLIAWLPQLALLDAPNQRSMHKQPVPRGGGWAVVLVACGMIFMLRSEIPQWQELLLGLGLLAMLSGLDDKFGVPAMWRLLLHCLVATLIIFTAPANSLQLLPGLDPILERGLLVLALVWYLNLTNFMDGIDGLTATQMLAIGLGVIIFGCALFALQTAALSTQTWLMASILCATALGFLTFNWHPARIFLGDVGSLPFGLLAGYLLLLLVWQGYGLVALLLPLYSVMDATITLGKRLWRGEKVWQAHREHYYQRVTLVWQRHSRTILWLVGCHLLLILIALATVFISPWLAALGPIFVGCLLALFARIAKAGP